MFLLELNGPYLRLAFAAQNHSRAFTGIAAGHLDPDDLPRSIPLVQKRANGNGAFGEVFEDRDHAPAFDLENGFDVHRSSSPRRILACGKGGGRGGGSGRAWSRVANAVGRLLGVSSEDKGRRVFSALEDENTKAKRG